MIGIFLIIPTKIIGRKFLPDFLRYQLLHYAIRARKIDHLSNRTPLNTFIFI